MAVIRERVSATGTKSYHVQVRIKGFPPQTKTFASKTMAKQWAAMVETELKAGRYLPRVVAERHTLAELIDRYRKEVLPQKKAKFIRDQTVHLDWWEAKLVWCLKSKHQIIVLAARATDAKMVSALLCHTNGLGSSL